MKNFCLSLILLITYSSIAQDIEWQKSFGGSNADVANSIQETHDKGFIFAGHTSSSDGNISENNGDYDMWIVKIDSIGSIEWEKSFGGSGDDRAYSIQQTIDSGYIVAGFSYSSDGDVTTNLGSSDYWVLKIDLLGNLEWEKSYGGSIGDVAQSIQQTNDGGYIIAGGSGSNDGDVSGHHPSAIEEPMSDYWVVKIDSIGNIQWENSLGGGYEDGATSVQQTSDGGYIVAGNSYSDNGDISNHINGCDYWVVKLDSEGIKQWDKSLGGTINDFAYSIQQTIDDGYIVAGMSNSFNWDVTENHGDFDYWLVKLDSVGVLEWERSFGGSLRDYARSVHQTNDEGYIITGHSESIDYDITNNHGDWDFWLVKTDSSGNLQWEKSLGGSSFDWSYSIIQTSDDSYIVIGETESIDGDVTDYYGSKDIWVVKLADITSNETSAEKNQTSFYPNPSSGIVNIKTKSISKIEVYNLIGKKILISQNKKIDISNQPAGVYYIKIYNGEETLTEKIIKL